MVYRYRALNCCHGIEMWKYFSLGNGSVQCHFLSFGTKKHRKKFGGIKNIAYFCGQSWSRRKRTAAMKTRKNERIERYLAR